MTVTAYIALGSNLGNRQNNLDRALQLLRAEPGITVSKVSHYHETEPVGGPAGQAKYLNAAAEIRTDLEPDALLSKLLAVEAKLGRVRREPNGPRVIDLDLLLYGDAQLIDVRPGFELQIPHPRMHERTFVLEPLAEVAPQVVHPRFGVSVHDLLKRLRTPVGEKTVPELGGLPRPEEKPARELAGLRAAVTGSTSGIGQAIALEMASAGADVIIHGRRSREAAEAIVAQVRSHGVRGRAVMADLREPDACHRLVEAAWSEWGGLDIWINNAGADTLTGAAADWPFERKLSELLAVDVTATVLLGRAVGQRMRAQGSGVIINQGWDQAETGMEGDSGQLFAAAKGAVMAFTRSLAVSLAPQVRVNALAPGWIRTAWGAGASERWQERARRESPLGRWGTPQDVAAAARWLVSPAASFITGQIIRVNGGAVR